MSRQGAGRCLFCRPIASTTCSATERCGAFLRPVRHIPNIISILRILLVIPVVMLLLDQRYGAALLLFAIAGISDGVDGFLAKRFGWQSRLGSILDPLADKLLLIAFHYRYGRFEMQPTRVSKVNTFFQIVLVLAVVFYHGEFAHIPWIVDALVYIVWATTLISGANYVWIWGRRALATPSGKGREE